MSSFANYNVAGSPSGSAGGRGNDNSRSHDDAEKPSADNVSLSELETAMKLLPMLQQLTAQPQVNSEPLVGVFWDYENLKLPPNYTPAIAETINTRLRSMFGFSLHTKNCYFDSKKKSEEGHVNAAKKEVLSAAGFAMIDCPTRGKKETIDKRMIVDILRFMRLHARDRSDVTIVLISQDGDYAYMINEIKDAGAKVCLAYGPMTANVLFHCADTVISFRELMSPLDNDVADPVAPPLPMPIGLEPMPGVPIPNPVARVNNISESAELDALLSIVESSQAKRLYETGSDWADASVVAGLFNKKSPFKLKVQKSNDYKRKVETAILAGLIIVGRRRKADNYIEPLSHIQDDVLKIDFEPQKYFAVHRPQVTDYSQEGWWNGATWEAGAGDGAAEIEYAESLDDTNGGGNSTGRASEKRVGGRGGGDRDGFGGGLEEERGEL